jgi:NTE family protein
MNNYKTGLCLSGGGARGIVHLGVLQALEEAEIYPDFISGTSAGAIAGAFYAAGYSPRKIYEIIENERLLLLLRPAVSLKGLLDIRLSTKAFAKYLPEKFEDLKIPLTVNATDLYSGKSVFFDSGNLYLPVQASCCIPLIFQPIEYDKYLFVDGGIINNLPVEPLLNRSDFIIGVHSNPTGEKRDFSTFTKVLERTQLLSISRNTILNSSRCHLLIEPPEMAKFNVFDLRKASQIFEIGYQYAKKYLLENKNYEIGNLK